MSYETDRGDLGNQTDAWIKSEPSDIPADHHPMLEQDWSSPRTRRRTRFPLLSLFNFILLSLQLALLTWHVTTSKSPVATGTFGKTYGANTNYMTLDHNYDFLWEDRATKKAGVIILSQDEQGKVTEYGAISMFHQLHCLASFRHALQEALAGRHVAIDWTEDPHWPHCLYYLRQMILCNADGQLEGQHLWNNSSPFIDGAEDVRQCKDNKPLYDLFDAKGS